jgi:AbrB family looped-hinge helix DNA binding protein
MHLFTQYYIAGKLYPLKFNIYNSIISSLMMKKKAKEYVHTVTRLGTVTIPIPIRRKYGISKGSKVRFVETDEGIQLVPLTSIKSLFGVDSEKEGTIQGMIREILNERK